MMIRTLCLTLILLSAPAFAQTAAPESAAPVQKLSGDTNHDGAWSKAEYLAIAQRRFDLMDADKDGTVTAQEKTAFDNRPRKTPVKAGADDSAQKPSLLKRFFN